MMPLVKRYIDYQQFADLTDQEGGFTTRMKSGAYLLANSTNIGVICDDAKKRKVPFLRLVKFIDCIYFLTS